MTHFKTLFNLNCFSEDAAARALAAEQLQQQYNCEINCVQVDESVQFAHNGKGCTIAAAKLSAGVVIFQNVTIGANQTYNKATQRWENLGSPVLGKNVVVADGAKVVGPIIVGDDSLIGAGAIITKDVPANSIAYGVNKFKPRDVDHAPVFYKDMPNGEDIVAACNDVIARYEATTK
ncbi:LbetaH domain-containing protein [Furfurilactobacillus entadae]|uniref:serine acetyltransferase n=1 Tax=Furfurilactobacillus entadae TaxID=2922307 RepID=UPI0035EF774E